MAEHMTVELASRLREAFPADHVGKLPRIICPACRDDRQKVCQSHSKSKCSECGNWITSAHLHLDYVGHADVTDRLIAVDPLWTWEPLAFDAAGLPALDVHGGLWIRLTVAGVTRLGYGDAQGKRGGDAVKEVIGDAIRNAAMRFGVALDLWRKEPPATEEAPRQPRRQQVAKPEAAKPAEAATELVSQAQHRRMHALWRELGYPGEANREQRLTITAGLIKREITSSAELTAAEADKVIEALEARKRQQAETPVGTT